MAEGRPFRLLLEPMNPVDAPTALFTRLDDAVSMLRDRLGGRIGLLFDLYHLTMAGDDPVGGPTAERRLFRGDPDPGQRSGTRHHPAQ